LAKFLIQNQLDSTYWQNATNLWNCRWHNVSGCQQITHHFIPEDDTLHGNLTSHTGYSLYTEVLFLKIAMSVENGKCTDNSEVGDHRTVRMVGSGKLPAHHTGHAEELLLWSWIGYWYSLWYRTNPWIIKMHIPKVTYI
jgi:hypothetical protein